MEYKFCTKPYVCCKLVAANGDSLCRVNRTIFQYWPSGRPANVSKFDEEIGRDNILILGVRETCKVHVINKNLLIQLTHLQQYKINLYQSFKFHQN